MTAMIALQYLGTVIFGFGKSLVNGTFEAFIFAFYGITQSIANGYYFIQILRGKEIVVPDTIRNNKVFTKLTAFKAFRKFVWFSTVGGVASFIFIVLYKFWYFVGSGVQEIFKH